MPDASHLDSLGRRNTGRPLGARDRYPRKRKPKGETAAAQAEWWAAHRNQLEAALGEAYAKIRSLEEQLGVPKFAGDAVALLQATQRGEYFPSTEQLYASKLLYERDLDKRVATLAEQHAQLDEQSREFHEGDARLERLIADFENFTADREAELSALIASGDVTLAGAEVLRRWFIKPEPKQLEPPNIPHNARKAECSAASI